MTDRTSDRWSRVLTVITGALVLANAAVILRLVWGHLNYVQIDHAGHIQSAAAFGRGEYHQFSDQTFLGNIHGLFYPPLQDVLLSIIDWISGDDYVLSYKVYLSLLVISYLGATVRLAMGLERRVARAFLLGGLLFLMNVEKPDLVMYQGLSFVDLWLTGLSSQVLGGVFLLVLIREWLGPARPSRLGAWLALCVLSHLVVGFVALALLSLAWIQHRQRGLAFAVLGALGLSAFFWIPFVFNRSTITNSNILLIDPLVFAGTAAVGVWLAFRHRHARTLFALALLLLAPMIVGPWLSELGIPYPRFHYYRFAIIALFLIVIGYAVLIEAAAAERIRWRRWALVVAVGVLCLAGSMTFRFQRFSRDWPSLTASDVQVDDPRVLELPEYGRFWVIGDARSIDFGIDSMLATSYPEFRSTKGLFWESYRHHTLLSSWYATLLGTPVVLDYFYFQGYSCDVQACLVDHFVRDYNVQGLIVDERLPLAYAAPLRRECYRQLLRDGGTTSFELVKQGAVRDAQKSYTVFRIAPRGRMSNRVLEAVEASEITAFDRTRELYYAAPIQAAYASCTQGQPERTFIDERGVAAMPSDPPTRSDATLSFTKQSPTTFEIVVDSPQPILFRIKLAYLPGVELVGEHGGVPLFESMSGMVAYGHGRMTLRYERPPGVLLGYLVSVLVAAGLVARWIVLRRRRTVSSTANPSTAKPAP